MDPVTNIKAINRGKHRQSDRLKNRHGKQRGKRGGAVGSRPAHEEVVVEEENSSEEETTQVGEAEEGTRQKQRGKYSRRQITSNADRYKELPDDEEAELREELEAMKALMEGKSADHAPDSHFRFRHEAEWTESESSQHSASAIADVNCDALIRSLATLPLDLKLRFDPALFEPELAPFLKRPPPPTSSPLQPKQSSPSPTLPTASSTSPQSASAAIQKIVPASPPQVQPAVKPAATQPVLPPASTQPKPAPPQTSKPTAPAPKAKTETQDMKDLDDLLNLSAAQAPSATTGAKPAAAPTASATTSKPAGKETGNLEDWLDSVI